MLKYYSLHEQQTAYVIASKEKGKPQVSGVFVKYERGWRIMNSYREQGGLDVDLLNNLLYKALEAADSFDDLNLEDLKIMSERLCARSFHFIRKSKRRKKFSNIIKYIEDLHKF